MNIYLITIPYQGYDTFDGHVIIAKTPNLALDYLLNGRVGDEGKEIWKTEGQIKKIGTTTLKKPQTVLSSYNAG